MKQRNRDELREQAGLAMLDHSHSDRRAADRGGAELDRPHQAEPAHVGDDLVAIDQRSSSAQHSAPIRPARCDERRRVPAPGASRAPRPRRGRCRRIEPWRTARSIPSNTRSKRRARRARAPIGTSPPDSALARQIRSGSRSQCSSARKRPVRPIPVWTSSQTNSVPASRQSRCAAGEVAVGREVDPLALDRLDDRAPRRPRARAPARSRPRRRTGPGRSWASAARSRPGTRRCRSPTARRASARGRRDRRTASAPARWRRARS